MKLIRPTVITDAMLTSSDVPEGAGTAWSSATTYAVGARVDVATGTVIDVYQSLQASNTNHAPASSPTWWRKVATTYAAYNSGTTYAKDVIVSSSTTHRRYQSVQAANTGHPLTDALWWTDIGPTNRWSMFDRVVGTASTETGAINVVLTPGATDSVGILDTNAETVTVTMTNGSTVVYSKTQSTNVGGSVIDDWFLYFFEPIGKRTALTFLDLPPAYPSATVSVTLTAADPNATVSVGTIIVGRALEIGSTEVGASVGITDYSAKSTDSFGVTSVVERPWSKRMEIRCILDTGQVDAMQRELAKLRAIPVLYIGEEGFDSLTIYGFFKDFSFDIAYSNLAYCSMTVEGLI